jgi:hypothetical protein
MPYPRVSAAATAAGRYFTSQLAFSFRARDRYLDSGLTSFVSLLDSTTGHFHDGTRSNTQDYFLVAAIQTFTSGPLQNNLLDFDYSGGTDAPTTPFLATIAADPSGIPRTPTQYAAAIQAAIDAEIGSGKVEVIYLDPLIYTGNPSAGRMRFRHLGSTDTPFARRLKLKLGTGLNADVNCAPAMGFARIDRMGQLFYVGDFGWYDGFLEDRIILGDGGKIGAAGIKDANGTDAGATAAKYGTGVFTSAKVDEDAVIAGKIANAAVSGRKIGSIASNIGVNVANGAWSDFTLPLSQDRRPVTSCYPLGGTGGGPMTGVPWMPGLKLTAGPTSLGGGVWSVRYQNDTGIDLQLGVVGF